MGIETPAPESAAPLVTSDPVVAPAPVIEATLAPAPEPVAIVEPTPAAEAPLVEPVAEPAPAVEAAPVAEPAAEVPAEPAAAAAEEVAKPAYDVAAFKLPEGLKAEAKQLEAFTTLLGETDLRTQEGAQKLLDLHATSLKEFAETCQKDVLQKQQDAFTDMRAGWVKDFEKRAGNRANTILSDVKSVITDSIKDTKERTAFWNALAVTGAGDNPDVILGLAKLARRLKERTAPPPGIAVRSTNDPVARRYGGNGATKR